MLKKSGNKTSKELYKEFLKKPHEHGFITFAMKVIGELEAEGKPVASHYRAAIRSFLRFTKGKEVSFERLTSKTIVRYDKWLTKEGIVRNTAATYLRTLQTIYNKAIKEGVVEANGQEPFGGVNKSVQKAEKREALSLAELATIKKVDLSSDPKLALARDMFMFSVYMHGMTFFDMSRLKSSNVHNGVVSYKTNTAKGTIVDNTVRLSSSISEIIDRYNKHGQPYIFPVATEEEGTNEFRLRIKDVARQMNQRLREIAERTGITKNISMLSAWDTWHDLVENNDIIGALLKHNNSDEGKQQGGRPVEETENTDATIKESTNASARVKQDELWFDHYQKVVEYLKDKNAIPTQTSDKKLYQWLYRQSELFKKGKMYETRIESYLKLTKVINDVKRRIEKKNKKAEARQRDRLLTERLKQKKSRKKGKYGKESVGQDDLWNKKWQAYKEFMEKNHRRPSKHKEKDMVLFDWFKFNKKLLNRGKMRTDRKERFQQLIDQIEGLHKERANLSSYSDGKENVRQELHDSKEETAREKETSPKITSKFELSWQKSCKSFEKFLEDNGTVPKQKADRKLYVWFIRQKKLLREGTLPESRQEAFTALLEKVADVEKSKETTAHKRKKTYRIKIRVDRSKPVKQDDMWSAKWQAYYDYMAKNQCRPSKYKEEDMVLVNWFKHSKKLLNQGKLQEDRKERFLLLAKRASELTSINLHKELGKSGRSEEVKPRKEQNVQIKEASPKREVVLPKKGTIQLYDYQQDMKDRIEKSLKVTRSVMVQMPTGTGKTHVVAAVVKDFISNNGNKKVWIVAHRRELVKQMKRTLALYLTKEELKQVLATSIQWLTLHYNKIDEKPSLIVIDEAHHAVAKTYAAVMNAYPKARKLGVTATPYRLSGEGFSELFDTLLTSADIRTFIARKRLCPFDYYVVDNNSEEVNKLLDIKKRGIDGDYQTKELDRKFNDTESIRRLYESYMKYAKGKKGFVYAISIHHAENIARYYQEQGLNAMAISSKTPEKERDEMIRDFKKGKINLLVSCDLLSEGFDYPDAEVIQIARPTLSLAKYMQMVGRGLRMAKGKDYCIIIDNVGLADRFGLPDRERDWKQYFKGFDKNNPTLSEFRPMGIGEFATKKSDNDDDIHLALSHNKQESEISLADQVEVFEDGEGKKGLRYKDGKVIFECEYKDIAISSYGIVDALSFGNNRQWYDLYNGVIYYDRPIFDYLGDIPVAIAKDCIFPRIRSKWITQKTRISMDKVQNLYDSGLEWFSVNKGKGIKRVEFFIPWSGKLKVYKIVKSTDYGARLLEDEDGRQYAQQNPDTELIEVKGGSKETNKLFASWKQSYDDFVKRAKTYPITYIKVSNLPSCGYTLEKEGSGIIEATSPEGNVFWVDTITRRKFNVKPIVAKKGGAKILFVDDYVFVRDNKFEQPVQYWQVDSDTDGHYWVSSDTHVSSLKDYHVKKMDWWWKN